MIVKSKMDKKLFIPEFETISINIESYGKIYYQIKKDKYKKKLIFLHGLGVFPIHYRELLNELSKHYEVIVPILFGINYLDRQPSTINEYSELTKKIIESVGSYDSYIIGHSLGGTIGMILNNNKIIAINPLAKTKFGTIGYLFKTTLKTLNEVFGNVKGEINVSKKGFSIIIPFLVNAFKKMKSSQKLFKDIFYFKEYENLNKNSIILYGKEDEYYKDHNNLKDLNLKMIEYDNKNHDWILFDPKFAVKEILKILK